MRKWVWGTGGPGGWKDLRTLSLLFLLPALCIWALGLDAPLARILYHPELEPFGLFLRRHGNLPGTVLAALAVFALLIPGLWQRRPLVYRTALVMALTAILGVGLFNQVIIKKTADRLRPLESVLADPASTPAEGLRGNSMPSGHAAMGFLVAAPFFPLRRQKPRLAAVFLGAGLITGSLVGLSRMALGAHFATDVLAAAALTLGTAAIFTHLTHDFKRLHPTIMPAVIVVACMAVVLGNRFTNLQLTLPLSQPVRGFRLPCQPVSTPVVGTAIATLTVSLNGYGAPLSSLKLVEKEGIISLHHRSGLYHSLSCTAQLALPDA